MNRPGSTAIIAVAAALALIPMTALAGPTPSPPLDSVLAAPPASDYNELTTSPLHGKFTAHDWANLSNNSRDAAETESTLNRYGFVDGYGKAWTQASSGHALIEAVMAFSGGRGAHDALTGMEAADKSDTSYQKADIVDGIATYYGAHFVDSTQGVIEDFFAFAKGNDVFGIEFISSKDDILAAATTQVQSQFSSAPDSTIPTSQWPENTTRSVSYLAGGAFGLGIVFIVIVLAVVGFLALRRRGAPAMAAAGPYGMAGMPGAMVAPTPEVQMSPDGNYWWDGQTWRDAAHEAPPSAQRSSDGAYWWDGRTWRLAPQVTQPPPQP